MSTSKLFVVLGVLFIVAGALFTIMPPRTDSQPVACDADAKLCSDGSAVGRTGPNCEFALCPSEASCQGGDCSGTSAGGGGSILPYNSGIRGTIMVGPTCPVERMPPDPKCADKPLQTNVSVYRVSDITKSIAFLSSGVDGTFEVSLPPGEYMVMAGPFGVPMPRCSDTMATVGPNGYTSITVSCDSGIR